MRIGYSSDLHQLVCDRKLMIGGIEIPYHLGTLGHSDGDPLLHAIAESILGALALGDLGHHFSDKDEKNKGLDSTKIIEYVYNLMVKKQYFIGNIDTMIYIESPKMSPYIEVMREKIAVLLHTSIENVSVKATTYEGLDAIGQNKAVMATAVVLLKEINNVI